MGKIKIKHHTQNTDTKLLLLNILANNNIYASRIIQLHDGFNVITSLEEETDLIFDLQCMEALRDNNFSPIMPPELKSKRTIIMFGIDPDAFSHTPEEIIQELYRVNAFTENMIDSTYKFPRGNTLKITFKNTAPALKSLEQGLKLFNTRVAPHQLQREEYYPIKTCMRCYEVDTHNTPECPKPREYKICSECATEGHTWQNCPSQNKQCINCGETHRTLASKCPTRKAALQKAKEAAKEKQTQGTSYSAAAASGQLPPLPSQSYIKDSTALIQTCILHSMVKEMGEPGTYHTELNKALKLNNFPEVKLPSTPNVRAIYGAITPTEPTSLTTNLTQPPPPQTTSPTPSTNSNTLNKSKTDRSSPQQKNAPNTPTSSSSPISYESSSASPPPLIIDEDDQETNQPQTQQEEAPQTSNTPKCPSSPAPSKKPKPQHPTQTPSLPNNRKQTAIQKTRELRQLRNK